MITAEAVISLFAIQPEQYHTSIISPALGILLLMIAVIVFAYFIHYIAKSIQINLYIQNLVKENSKLIDKKRKSIEKDPHISNEKLDSFTEILQKEAWEITINQSGFIQYYDEEKLYKLSKEKNIIIFCEKMIGEHILEGATLIKIYSYSHLDDIKKIEEQLRELVYIGDEINLYDDIGAGTKKLVEIAIRALSPGINDPNTAVFCIEKIGFLLQKIAKNLEAKIYVDEDKEVKLIVSRLTFERLLYDHFYQIKHYGIKDLVVLDAVLGALITISKDNNSFIKDKIWSFSQYLISDIPIKDYPEVEQSYIRERFYQLSRVTHQKLDFNKLFNH